MLPGFHQSLESGGTSTIAIGPEAVADDADTSDRPRPAVVPQPDRQPECRRSAVAGMHRRDSGRPLTMSGSPSTPGSLWSPPGWIRAWI
jgi:hypothetical protein